MEVNLNQSFSWAKDCSIVSSQGQLTILEDLCLEDLICSIFFIVYFFLLVCVFTSQSRNFHSNGDSPKPGKGFKFWPTCIIGTQGYWAGRQDFFNVSHLLWHGTSVYKGHLRGPVTLTVAERLSCHYLILTT